RSVLAVLSYLPPCVAVPVPTRRSSDLGADVAVNDLDPATAARTADEIKGMGHASAGIPGDVSKADEVQRACDEAEAALGGIDILDRKSTRLNSSHEWISYAVFCL